MLVHQLPVGPFEMNCYIAADPHSRECFLIDAGDEADKLISFIKENDYQPIALINTHAHIDHTRRVSELKNHFKIPFYMGEKDLPLLETLKNQGIAFGMDVTAIPEVDHFLADEQELYLGKNKFVVYHTPGHSPGSISLYTTGHLFVGDVLFLDSVGRTDLYGGDYRTLMNSIRNKLLVLPDDTQVYSGHGPTTTIGREKKHNPFLNPTASPV